MKFLKTISQKASGLIKPAMFTIVSSLALTQVSAQDCLVSSLDINTGYDYSASALVAVGSPDPMWKITAVSPDLTTVISPASVPYYAPVITADAAWVTSLNSGWLGVIPANGFSTSPGQVLWATYTREFRMCLKDKIDFSFMIANDNYCTAVRVDGVLVPVGTPFSQPAMNTPAHFGAFTSFSFSLNLAPGPHKIELDIYNFPINWPNNPMGLDLEGTLVSAGGLNSLVGNTCQDYACCSSAFTWSSSSQSPDIYTFTALDPAAPGAYEWTVNGTVVSTAASFSTYLTPGFSYVICLRIMTEEGVVMCETCVTICVSKNSDDGEDKPSGKLGAATENTKVGRVYPNPTNSELNVEFMNTSDKNISFKLYDANGKAVISETKSLKAGSQKVILNTGKLANAIYLLQVSDGDKVIMKQHVVKQ